MELLVMLRGSEIATCSKPLTGVTFTLEGGPMTATGDKNKVMLSVLLR